MLIRLFAVLLLSLFSYDSLAKELKAFWLPTNFSFGSIACYHKDDEQQIDAEIRELGHLAGSDGQERTSGGRESMPPSPCGGICRTPRSRALFVTDGQKHP